MILKKIKAFGARPTVKASSVFTTPPVSGERTQRTHVPTVRAYVQEMTTVHVPKLDLNEIYSAKGSNLKKTEGKYAAPSHCFAVVDRATYDANKAMIDDFCRGGQILQVNGDPVQVTMHLRIIEADENPFDDVSFYHDYCDKFFGSKGSRGSIVFGIGNVGDKALHAAGLASRLPGRGVRFNAVVLGNGKDFDPFSSPEGHMLGYDLRDNSGMMGFHKFCNVVSVHGVSSEVPDEFPLTFYHQPTPQLHRDMLKLPCNLNGKEFAWGWSDDDLGTFEAQVTSVLNQIVLENPGRDGEQREVVLVVDQNLNDIGYAQRLEQLMAATYPDVNVHIVTHDPGEDKKSFYSVRNMFGQLGDTAKKPLVCVAIGGGVTSNMTGVMAFIHRDARLVHIPTTLLNMNDAAGTSNKQAVSVIYIRPSAEVSKCLASIECSDIMDRLLQLEKDSLVDGTTPTIGDALLDADGISDMQLAEFYAALEPLGITAESPISALFDEVVMSKNWFGGYMEPVAVLGGISHLFTLPWRQIVSALGEASKDAGILGDLKDRIQLYATIRGIDRFRANHLSDLLSNKDFLLAFVDFLKSIEGQVQTIKDSGHAMRFYEEELAREGAHTAAEQRSLKAKIRVCQEAIDKARLEINEAYHKLGPEVKASIRKVNEIVVSAKSSFLTEEDPLENALAVIFEYGHTLAHAVEIVNQNLRTQAIGQNLYMLTPAQMVDLEQAEFKQLTIRFFSNIDGTFQYTDTVLDLTEEQQALLREGKPYLKLTIEQLNSLHENQVDVKKVLTQSMDDTCARYHGHCVAIGCFITAAISYITGRIGEENYIKLANLYSDTFNVDGVYDFPLYLHEALGIPLQRPDSSVDFKDDRSIMGQLMYRVELDNKRGYAPCKRTEFVEICPQEGPDGLLKEPAVDEDEACKKRYLVRVPVQTYHDATLALLTGKLNSSADKYGIDVLNALKEQYMRLTPPSPRQAGGPPLHPSSSHSAFDVPASTHTSPTSTTKSPPTLQPLQEDDLGEEGLDKGLTLALDELRLPGTGRSKEELDKPKHTEVHGNGTLTSPSALDRRNQAV